MNLNQNYFLCGMKDLRRLAGILEAFPALPINDRFQLACAPIKRNDALLNDKFKQYLGFMSRDQPCPVNVRVPLIGKGRPEGLLMLAESLYRTLDLYLWLATHFPSHFPFTEEALERREQCGLLVSRLLERISQVKNSKECRRDSDEASEEDMS